MTSSNSSRIVELSNTIHSNVQIVDAYFASQSLPSVSFDSEFPNDLPPSIQEAREAVTVATDELTDLMLGPRQIVECIPPHHLSFIGIQAINRWNVADHLAENEEATFKELADRCKVPEDDFTQILRQAMSRHLFKEPRKGIVAHTAASKLLIESTGLRDSITISLDEAWPSATRVLDAMERWNYSSDANKTGFNAFQQTEETFFGSMKSNHRRQKAFANSMSYMQSRPGFGSSVSHLLSSFDWNSVHQIVDVGGGLGDTSTAILRNTSAPQCIVQDLPDVVAQAKDQGTSTDLADRISFMEHDFFESQPVKDADVYILRWILHDWSDSNATTILRQLTPALKYGARVIIQESVVPASGTVSFYHEKIISCMDLSMKALFNSKERDIDAWVQLFANADERFKFVDVHAGNESGLAVLHFTWEGTKEDANQM